MKSIISISNKKRLVLFLRKYQLAKQRAHEFMSEGDINSYLRELLNSEKSKEQVFQLLQTNC